MKSIVFGNALLASVRVQLTSLQYFSRYESVSNDPSPLSKHASKDVQGSLSPRSGTELVEFDIVE